MNWQQSIFATQQTRHGRSGAGSINPLATVDAFYTKYKDDYLADMINEVVAQAKIKEGKSHDNDDPRLQS